MYNYLIANLNIMKSIIKVNDRMQNFMTNRNGNRIHIDGKILIVATVYSVKYKNLIKCTQFTNQ